MDILDLFDQLAELSPAHQWDALEQTMGQAAKALAGAAASAKIGQVDAAAYGAALAQGLKAASAQAAAQGHEAILFRYELEPAWSGQFHTCPSYEAFQGDEEWWATEAAPAGKPVTMPAFGAIYEAHGQEGDDASASVMLYLVGRTVANLGRQISKAGIPPSCALCAAYTGQEAFTRLVEPETGTGNASGDDFSMPGDLPAL
jgi:hypothetical protein